MSLLPEIPNPYLEALAVGLLYGLVFCTSTCLPYIAGYIAGIGAGFRRGTMVTLIFNSGRLTAYALIGGLVGLFSAAFGFLVNESALAPIQQYSSYAFGAVTIVIGISILYKSKSATCNLESQNIKNVGGTKTNRGFDVRAFSLGLSRGLIVCPPLVMLLVYSVPFAAPIDSLIVAVLFGLGTTLSPLLILGGVTGWLLNKAPLFRKWVSLAGAAILIVLGISTIVNAINVASP